MFQYPGGPGSGRATHSKRLIERYPGWVHLSMGDLLREQIMKEGSAGDKWDMVSTLVQRGEMAPEVCLFYSSGNTSRDGARDLNFSCCGCEYVYLY